MSSLSRSTLARALGTAILSGLCGLAQAAAFQPGNVVVYRVGDGAAGLVNTGAPIFLDEYTPSGTLVQSLALPTTFGGNQPPVIASGTASSEGLLTRSVDEHFLVLTGYGRELGGSGSISGTSAATVPRVVARVSAAGVVNTSTRLTDAADANNIRSVVSTDGDTLWVSGGAGGARLTGLGSTTSTQLSTALSNVRQLQIFGGQLYFSSGSGALRLGTVGFGLPMTAGQSMTQLAGVPTTGSPYGFALLDLSTDVAGVDTLYIADDAAGALGKYSLVGGTWTSNGVIGVDADDYRGLAAVVDAGQVTLFATRKGGTAATGGGELVKLVDASGYNGAFAGTPSLLASASANTAFRGVALAPVPPPNVAPQIAGVPSAFSGVRADPGDYGAQFGFDVEVIDDTTLPQELTVTAVSGNTTVIPATALHLSPLGGGNYNLTVDPGVLPLPVGYSPITVSVTDAQGATTTATLDYAISAAAADPAATIWPIGAADASATVAIDSQHMLVANDEDQVLRLYERASSGPALQELDVTGNLALTDISGGVPREVDIEASARVGNRLYFLGSHSNSSSGALRPNRRRAFSVDLLSVTPTTMAFGQHYDGLREDLLAWDAGNAHGLGANHFGFTTAAAAGVPPEAAGGAGFNIEGLSFVPGQTQAAYVGFRAPLVVDGPRRKAVLVTISNFADLVDGVAATPVFGAPIELDLGGYGIRSIDCGAQDCVIIAGSADGAGQFRLFTWSGVSGDAPVARSADLRGLNPESLVEVPEPLKDSSLLHLVSDQGDTVFYGDGIIAKDLPRAEHRKFRADYVTLGAPLGEAVFANGFE